MSDHPRVVAFDLDDTLYMERTYVRSGFEAVSGYVREKYGLSGFSEKAWDLLESGVRGKIFDETFRQLDRNDLVAKVGDLVEVYRAHVPVIELLPDARQVLADLRSSCRFAVISDGPTISQQKKVAALGLHNLVEVIILTGERGEGFSKPSPWAYQEVESRCNVQASSCAYIGDNPAKDFLGAKSRGWKTVRIRRQGGLHADVEDSPGRGADFEVRDLWDAMRKLGFPMRCEGQDR